MPFEDEDILEKIAQKFGVSKEEVARSRKMSAEYDKEYQRRRQRHKLFIREEIKRKQEEEYRKNNPDMCFCYRDGFEEEANHLYDEGDDIVGYEMRYSNPIFGDNEMYQSELFKCKRCGKKYGWPVAYYG